MRSRILNSLSDYHLNIKMAASHFLFEWGHHPCNFCLLEVVIGTCCCPVEVWVSQGNPVSCNEAKANKEAQCPLFVSVLGRVSGHSTLSISPTTRLLPSHRLLLVTI